MGIKAGLKEMIGLGDHKIEKKVTYRTPTTEENQTYFKIARQIANLVNEKNQTGLRELQESLKTRGDIDPKTRDAIIERIDREIKGLQKKALIEVEQ